MNVVIRTAEDGAVSLLVDEIGDVLQPGADTYEPPPGILTGPTRELVAGVHKLKDRLLLVLDHHRRRRPFRPEPHAGLTTHRNPSPSRPTPSGTTRERQPTMSTETTPAPDAPSTSNAALAASAAAAQARAGEAKANTTAVIRVVEAVSAATTTAAAITAALDAVKTAFGWAYGSFWALDAKENALKFAQESGSVNAEFRRATVEASFREGVGLSGRGVEDPRPVLRRRHRGDDRLRPGPHRPAGGRQERRLLPDHAGRAGHRDHGLLRHRDADPLGRAAGRAPQRGPARVGRPGPDQGDRATAGAGRQRRRRQQRAGVDRARQDPRRGRHGRADHRQGSVRLGLRVVLAAGPPGERAAVPAWRPAR